MILILGGTGAVGTHVTSALAGRDDVRALAHSDTSEQKLRDAGVRDVVRGDLAGYGTLDAVFAGVRRLFLLAPPGPDQASNEHHALDAAQAAGVERVVKLSVIYTGEPPRTYAKRPHEAIERRLAESRLSYVALRPPAFMTNLLTQIELIRQGQTIWSAGDARIPHVDPRDLGEVAAALLTRSADDLQGAHTITGPETLSFDEVAQRISSAIGRPVQYVNAPPEDWRAGLLDAGLPDWFADTLVEIYVDYERRGTTAVSDLTERVLGRPARRLDDFLRDTLTPALRAA